MLRYIKEKAAKGLYEFVRKNAGITQLINTFGADMGGGFQSSPLGFNQLVNDGYRSNSILFSGIDYIAEKANQVKIKACRKNSDGEIEIIEDHDILDALDNSHDYIANAIRAFTLFGNDFTYAKKFNPERDTEVLNFVQFMPQYCILEVKQNRFGEMYPLSLTLNFIENSKFTDIQNLIHTKYWSPSPLEENGYIFGMSPFVPASKIIKAHNEANESLLYMYENAGGNSVFSKKNESHVSNPEEIASAIRDKLRGKTKTGNIAYVNSELEMHKLTRDFKDLGIIETINLTDREILNILHLPSELFNDPENKIQANKSEAKTEAVYNAVIPRVTHLVSNLSRWARKNYKEKDLYLLPDYSDIKEIQLERLRVMKDIDSITFMSMNEKRKMAELSSLEIPEADSFIINNEIYYND